MTRSDSNHRIAEIMKGLEERVSNLEEKDRSSSTPNLLRTLRDRVAVDDSDLTIERYTISDGEWRDINERGGYTVSTWGSYQ